MGSEPGMGWNWILSLARHCQLHIITEGEFRPQIEKWMSQEENEEICRNVHFYYNPVSEKVRSICWNQGDWRFYFYYNNWQKKTADIAREICKTKRIDILHQLNMIGFREPGYLWKVSKETGIPFVWGPIGGLKQFPMAYAEGSSMKTKLFFSLKNNLNKWQLTHSPRIDAAIKQASLLVSSIPDSYRAIKKYKGMDSVIIPETGTFLQKDSIFGANRFIKENLTILWVGKFDFRKRLDIALAAIATVKKKQIQVVLKVFGTGSESLQQKALSCAKNYGIEACIRWMGSCPNSQVTEEMQKADLFLFTSVNEDTSTVVLEAMSNQLPVLCFDTCGMSAVIDDNVGCKIPLTTPKQSVNDFAEEIEYLYHHRDVLKQMSQNCQKKIDELSWEKKGEQMVNLYQEILK